MILLKQLPVLLGLAGGTTVLQGLGSPSSWRGPSLIIGGATIAAMTLAPKLTRVVPAAIIGLGAGIAAYAALAVFRPELRTLVGNGFVIGVLGGGGPAFGEALRARMTSLRGLHLSDLLVALGPASALAVVLSLDTLKTSVVVDALTGSRHESNRELRGQGIANALSAIAGGLPGSGTAGPTLVNLASGAQTRWSSVLEGVLVLFAYVALAGAVAWAPARRARWNPRRRRRADVRLERLALGAALLDRPRLHRRRRGDRSRGRRRSDHRVRGRSGPLDPPLHPQRVARRRHPPQARRRQGLLQAAAARQRGRAPTRHGHETAVIELQGSLFFGTTEQLRSQLQADLDTRRTIIFDLRRVEALDLTAAHILTQMQAQLRKRSASVVFCNLPHALAGQREAGAARWRRGGSPTASTAAGSAARGCRSCPGSPP